MLARVAESVYWMARYLERAENTARLVHSYNHLIMDIPKGSEPRWTVLVDILDARDCYEDFYQRETEANVHKFLLSKMASPSSIAASTQMARENLLVAREVLSEDVWERVNELHLYVSSKSLDTTTRRSRLKFLHEVSSICQSITGLLETTQLRDHAYRFMSIGRLLERSDMTARIVDVGAGDILDREGKFSTVDPLLWSVLLEALSAKSAYWRCHGPIIAKELVVDFSFGSLKFPRSVVSCLNELEIHLTGLGDSSQVSEKLNQIRVRVNNFRFDPCDRLKLHVFIENLHSELTSLHNLISSSWFRMRVQ